MTDYYAGQELQKYFDNIIVRINFVGKDYIRLDGDFEPNHVVMKEKVKHYYKEVSKMSETFTVDLDTGRIMLPTSEEEGNHATLEVKE